MNRRVSASQTGVSSDGIVLRMRTLPAVSASVTGFMSFPSSVRSGALSPTFNSWPTRVSGLPFIVVAPLRSIIASLSSVIGFRKI